MNVIKIKKTLLTSFLIIGIIVIVGNNIVGFLNIVGDSMYPNLKDNNKILVNKMIYSYTNPKRFDVVIFNPQDGINIKYIKRIIGLPGETIQIKNGETYINGELLKKDAYYKKEGYRLTSTKEYKLSNTEYFLMGDNRNGSTDSRSGLIGPIKRKNIIGKAISIYYPLIESKTVKHR